MYPIEFLIFGSTGYVCGLAISSGFMLRFVLHSFVQGKAKWRLAAWSLAAIVNIIFVTVSPIFLMTIFVDMKSENYWPRAATFMLCAIMGMALVFVVAHLIGHYVQRVRDGLESPSWLYGTKTK